MIIKYLNSQPFGVLNDHCLYLDIHTREGPFCTLMQVPPRCLGQRLKATHTFLTDAIVGVSQKVSLRRCNDKRPKLPGCQGCRREPRSGCSDLFVDYRFQNMAALELI